MFNRFSKTAVLLACLASPSVADNFAEEFFVTDLNAVISESVEGDATVDQLQKFADVLDDVFRASVLPVMDGDLQGSMNVIIRELSLQNAAAAEAVVDLQLKKVMDGEEAGLFTLDAISTSSVADAQIYTVLAQQLAAAARASLR